MEKVGVGTVHEREGVGHLLCLERHLLGSLLGFFGGLRPTRCTHGTRQTVNVPPAGLEPAVLGLEVQRLVH